LRDKHLQRFGHPKKFSKNVPRAPKWPDLVITDMWQSLGDICYEIANFGEAVAPKGHYTTLFFESAPGATDLVDTELEPGETLTRCFACERMPDLVKSHERKAACED
jgi:hypothetical protein